MESQESPKSQSNPEKERSRRYHTSQFKICYKAIVIKTMWYCNKKQKHRPMEQDQEPRNDLIHIQLTDVLQGSCEY